VSDRIPTFPEWIEDLAARVEDRDPEATIDLLIYAVSNAPGIPERTQTRLRADLIRYLSAEEETLDDALRLRWSRPQRRAAASQMIIYLEVVKEREAMRERKMSGGLNEAFAVVGERHGLGRTATSEIYYAVRRMIEAAKQA
jgi:hypothetical protein